MPNPQSSPRPRLIQPPPHDAYLSDGIAAYLLRQEQEGSAELTLRSARESAWLLLEFLGGDVPIRELSGDMAARWLDWMRTTFSYRRKRGSYPRQFSHATVSAFFRSRLVNGSPAPPLPIVSDKLRSAETVAKNWRHGGAILRWLGVPIEIERRKTKHFRRLPPRVPKLATIADRWRDVLATPRGLASPADRRRVVLTQALILLWGCRLHEGLSAQADFEGHWCLVEGKTGMRITYLNSQALGLVHVLRGQLPLFSDADERLTRISGWQWSDSHWHDLVRSCGAEDGAKPQQDLRKRASTWIKAADPEVEMVQLGHGGGVIFQHYDAVLERVPLVLERFTLPPVSGFAWPEPIYPHKPAGVAAWTADDEARAAADLAPPERLYQVFDRWLREQERLAAS